MTDDDREWAAVVADRQVQNLVRLTDDLLDVSRISKGKIQLKWRTSMRRRSSSGRARRFAPSSKAGGTC